MPVIVSSRCKDDPWQPLLDWPDGTGVQWGGGGLVLRKGGEGCYTTAFFEAFPKDGSGGFIRGEGSDLAAAEAHAHAIWSRQSSCFRSGGHRWSRALRLKGGKVSTYTNGGCHCLRCGSFETVMKPVVKLGGWRAPISANELNSIASGFCRRSPWSPETPEDTKWRKRMRLRARMYGITLPPEIPRDPQRHPLEQDDYEKGCASAVGAFCRAHLHLLDTGEVDGIVGLFDSLARDTLRRLAEAA